MRGPIRTYQDLAEFLPTPDTFTHKVTMVHLLATFPKHYGAPIMQIRGSMTENMEADDDPSILLVTPLQ